MVDWGLPLFLGKWDFMHCNSLTKKIENENGVKI